MKLTPIHCPPSSSLKSRTIAVIFALSLSNFNICPNFTGKLSMFSPVQFGCIISGIDSEEVVFTLLQLEIKSPTVSINAILVIFQIGHNVSSYAVADVWRGIGVAAVLQAGVFYNSLISSSVNPVNSEISKSDIPFSFIFLATSLIPSILEVSTTFFRSR